MMKLKISGLCFLLMVTVILMMGCNPNPDSDKVTVTFNANGGSPAPTSITLAKGSGMGDQYPADPVKEDFAFGGWYDGDTVYTAATPVHANITLTAQWTAQVTITFDTIGGSPIPLPITLAKGSGMGDQYPVDPQKANVMFDGWYDGTTLYAADTPVEDHITLKARWASGTPVSTWRGFIAPTGTTGTKATQYTTLKTKSDVLHVAHPSGSDYTGRVMYYDLSEYAGKEITIGLSMEVWLDVAAKVAWQVNLSQTSYPVVAGSTETSLSAGEWHTITGVNTITVPAGGCSLYLSSEQLARKDLFITNFIMIINDGSTPPAEGEIRLTVGEKQNFIKRLTNINMINKIITWTTSNSAVATVNSNGIVTAAGFTTGGSGTVSSAATGTATITARTNDNITETFTVTTTMEGQVDMMTLTPLKDQFAGYFPMMGNIATQNDYGNGMNTTITNTRLTRHYNVLTAENVMKPSYYGGTRNGTSVSGLTFTTPDAFVNAATASGFKVHAHVLLWHSQNSSWITALNGSTGKETALGAMRSYITQVMTHYKGKVYSWDVLNEVFPDGVSASANWKTSMRTTGDSQAANPWFVAIGSDFVYEGFKAARLADPAAILYYNDYNMDSVGKSTMVANMVEAVNNQWKNDQQNTDKNRLLIEGIGLQSHHNTAVTAAAVKASLDRFRPLGVKLSISEIDVLSQTYNEYSSSIAPTNNGKLTAANLYGQYFKHYIDNADIIERVTFWGVYDSQSWRARGLPLIFEGATTSKAKPAYYKVINALDGN
jgi:uncharacterized repeat protein (TIGR02543 family)